MTNELKKMIDAGYETDEIVDMIAEGDEDIKTGLIQEIEALADAVDEADLESEDED